MANKKNLLKWQGRIHEIIFEADTPAGKLFDLVLLIFILMSVLVVGLETIPEIQGRAHKLLRISEWILTILFTLEYFARIYAVKKPLKYIFSFFGIIDLLAILPSYLSLFFAGSQAYIVIRIFRLLRVFRVLKLAHFLGEAEILKVALKESFPKISVFLITVICIVVITGTTMYNIEGPANGFTSIPISIYWTIVTLTTVGYGDIAPQTPMGQMLASVLMILGYGIIAVPTGIVTANIARADRIKDKDISRQACPACASENHQVGAKFCKDCGAKL
ncbi:MAG: ion transporter [Cyclobacteriaceae bacterium]